LLSSIQSTAIFFFLLDILITSNTSQELYQIDVWMRSRAIDAMFPDKNIPFMQP
jgi:hypothetical protein